VAKNNLRKKEKKYEDNDPRLILSVRKVIPLAEIVRDRDAQFRDKLSPERVEELTAVLESGREFKDDVEVYYVGAKYWPGDGHHRLEAYERAKRVEVPAIVREGGRRHAMVHAAGANAEHGLPRTSKEKRRAVRFLLEDKEIGKLSGRAVAKIAHCDNKTVEEVKKELGLKSDKVTRTDKHGNVGELDVSGLRNRKKSRLPEGQVYFFTSLPPLARDALKDVLLVASSLKPKQYGFLRSWLIDHLPAKVEEVAGVLSELEKEDAEAGNDDESTNDKPEQE
jgi:ParB-like chromosome segregation protein Spo0J